MTANEAHGIRCCPIEIVKADLVERNLSHNGLTHDAMRLKLELILREEEEFEGLNMYRRDKRLRVNVHNGKRKLGVDRIILDMLHI